MSRLLLIASIASLSVSACGNNNSSNDAGGLGANATSSPTSSVAPTSGTAGVPDTSAAPGAASGGGGVSNQTFYWSIDFTVSGLDSGASLVILLNGGYPRTITQNLSWPQGAYLYVPGQPSGYAGLPIGSTYSITVGTQPSGQMCTVTGGSGTLMTSAGPSVAAITCTSTATAGGASGVSHSSDIYASRSAVAHQTPGARQGAASFADGAGNFWLFGGTGYDSAHNACSFSDLWRLAMDSNRWTLIAGSDANNAAGRYGTQGVSSPNVGPGARAYATTWTDAGGNLWLFGGQGRDGAGTLGLLNDLWKFTVDNDQWTWVAGSDKANAPGAYEGDTGPTPDKVPAARSGAVSWIDSAGNLWLFGGYGIDPTGAVGTLNDLWQFTPATGSWTRMSGSLTSAGA